MFNRCPRPNPMDSMQGQMNTGFIDIDNNSGNIDIDFAASSTAKHEHGLSTTYDGT